MSTLIAVAVALMAAACGSAGPEASSPTSGTGPAGGAQPATTGNPDAQAATADPIAVGVHVSGNFDSAANALGASQLSYGDGHAQAQATVDHINEQRGIQ